MIPFVDLKAQYQSIKDEVNAAVLAVLESTAFVLGPEVEAFEALFAPYASSTFALGVNTGTSALHLALLAAEVGSARGVTGRERLEGDAVVRADLAEPLLQRRALRCGAARWRRNQQRSRRERAGRRRETSSRRCIPQPNASASRRAGALARGAA